MRNGNGRQRRNAEAQRRGGTQRTPTACGMVLCALICAATVGCRKDTGPAPPEPEPVADVSFDLVLERTFDANMGGLAGIALDAEDNVYLAGAGGVRVLDAAGQMLQVIPTDAPTTCVAVALDGRVWVGHKTSVASYSDGELQAAWGKAGTGPGELAWVTGIAVSGDDVYVADAGNRIVHRFAINGDYVGAIGAADADAGVPGIVCPTAHLDCVPVGDELHVNNPGRLFVERYTPDGDRLGLWGGPGSKAAQFFGCCNPTDIALLGRDRMVATSKGTNRLRVYTLDGKLLAFAGRANFSTSQSVGRDVATDSQGRIWVADPGDGKVRVFALKARSVSE
jgi:sugar lactone lactonase YvrE